jgi:hypothetical protein
MWRRMGQAFIKAHPQVRLSFNLSDRVVDLSREGYDLAIRIGGALDPNCVAIKLAANRRVVCGTPSYFKRHGKPKSLDDLARHNCLAFNLQGGQQHGWLFRKNGRPVNVKVAGSLDCSDGDLLHRWAVEGLGIAWRSTWEIAPELERGELVTVLDDYALPSTTSTPCIRQHRHVAGAAAPLHRASEADIRAPAVTGRRRLDFAITGVAGFRASEERSGRVGEGFVAANLVGLGVPGAAGGRTNMSESRPHHPLTADAAPRRPRQPATSLSTRRCRVRRGTCARIRAGVRSEKSRAGVASASYALGALSARVGRPRVGRGCPTAGRTGHTRGKRLRTKRKPPASRDHRSCGTYSRPQHNRAGHEDRDGVLAAFRRHGARAALGTGRLHPIHDGLRTNRAFVAHGDLSELIPGNPSPFAIARARSWNLASASLSSEASAASRARRESENVIEPSFIPGCSAPASADTALKSRLSRMISARVRQPVIWFARS